MIPKKLKLTQHDFWSNQSKAYKGADYKSMKDRVKDRDGATCRQCGKPLPNKRRAHNDHLLDVADGGTHRAINGAQLCERCHVLKSPHMTALHQYQPKFPKRKA